MITYYKFEVTERVGLETLGLNLQLSTNKNDCASQWPKTSYSRPLHKFLKQELQYSKPTALNANDKKNKERLYPGLAGVSNNPSFEQLEFHYTYNDNHLSKFMSIEWQSKTRTDRITKLGSWKFIKVTPLTKEQKHQSTKEKEETTDIIEPENLPLQR